MLVVDDDAQMSQLICAALSLRGIKLVCVGTFGAALVEVMRGNCETVLLDLGLPDSPPDKTLNSIAFLLEQGAGQIIVMTGSDVTDQIKEIAIKNGAREVLQKDGNLFVRICAMMGLDRPSRASGHQV